MIQFTLLLLPIALALAIIFYTKKTVLGLLAGAITALIILHKGSVPLSLHAFWVTSLESIKNPWHYSALVFTCLLGGFAVLIETSGGLKKMFSHLTSVKALQLRVMGLGLMCFFDGLANSLIVGRVVRPVADKLGLPRERLAYLVDTTSATVACIAPISTWIAMQLGLIATGMLVLGISGSPYEVFLQSIPMNFYCLFALAVAFYVALRKNDFAHQENRNENKNQSVNQSEEKQERKVTSSEDSSLPSTVGVKVALIPIAVLFLSIPVLFYLWEASPYFPISGEKLSLALGGSSGPYVFIVASVVALSVAFLMHPEKVVASRIKAVWKGMKQMLKPLLVLVSAWIFGSTLQQLGVGVALAELISQCMTTWLFPSAVFLTGCLLAFTTGTSWGTMALLFPLAVAGMAELEITNLSFGLSVISAAVFSGAVFGDHCSPFSDTTIVSSVACGIPTEQHVKTQLPYALISGLAALCLGFLPIGFLL